MGSARHPPVAGPRLGKELWTVAFPLEMTDLAAGRGRRHSRRINVGKVPVGGGAPVSVQSMTITKTADIDATLAQIYELAAAGADIVRCTCNEPEAAEG